MTVAVTLIVPLPLTVVAKPLLPDCVFGNGQGHGQGELQDKWHLPVLNSSVTAKPRYGIPASVTRPPKGINMATKNFSVGAWFIVILGSLVPNLLGKLLALISARHDLPYQVKPYLEILNQLPWPGLVFGLTFSLACCIALSHKTQIGFNEWFAMMLLCPLAQYLVPLVVSVLAVFLKGVEFPLFIVMDFLYALLLAVLIQGLLYIELGGGVIFFTAVVGASVSAVSLVKELPIYPAEYWYVFVGGFLGIFVAKQAV
jgi:hypothetical protein